MEELSFDSVVAVFYVAWMLKPSQRDRLRKEQGRNARKGDNTDIVKVLMVAALYSAAFLFVELHRLHHDFVLQISNNNSAPSAASRWLWQLNDR